MGVNGDYVEGGLNISFGYKGVFFEGEEEMDGIVNSDVLKGVVFNGDVSVDIGGGGFRV